MRGPARTASQRSERFVDDGDHQAGLPGLTLQLVERCLAFGHLTISMHETVGEAHAAMRPDNAERDRLPFRAA